MSLPYNLLTKKILAKDLFTTIDEFPRGTAFFLSMDKIKRNGEKFRWSGQVHSVTLSKKTPTSHPPAAVAPEIKVVFAGEEAWAGFQADIPLTIHILTNDLGEEHEN